MEYRQIPEVHIQNKRLGRHVHHDPTSKRFVADLADKIVDTLHASAGDLPFDQQHVGSCTGESITEAADSDPNYDSTKPPRTQKDAYSVYGRETADAGTPWPPNDPGGSGLAVCKAAVEMGWITSYSHAFGIDQALAALVVRPVIVGVNWYDSFDTPDPATGLVSIADGASVRGGHEICATEIRAAKEEVWFWQSWGPGYGQNGRFGMTFATLDRLLQEQGDVTVPVV